MSGYYFTNKRYCNDGNALLPTELAARDKRSRQPAARTTIVNKKKKKKKTKLTNAQQIKAKNNKGNINSINLSLGGMGGGSSSSSSSGGASSSSGGASSFGGGYMNPPRNNDGALVKELSRLLRERDVQHRRDRPQPRAQQARPQQADAGVQAKPQQADAGGQADTPKKADAGPQASPPPPPPFATPSPMLSHNPTTPQSFPQSHNIARFCEW